MNTLYTLLCLLNLSVTRSSPCETINRKFNCECILQSSNRTVFFENDDQYNVSSNNFLPAVQSLKYCDGSFLCKTDIKQTIPPTNISSHLLCFSDVSCLLDKGFEDPCSCMHLRELHEYSITNDAFEMGIYTCIRVGPDDLKAPYCLKPACKSFTAIERSCICPNQSWNCTCSPYCNDLSGNPSQGTYTLFFSFGDMYVISVSKSSYVHWLVVTALFIGLIFLLLTFCKLCEKVVDTRGSPSAKSPCVEERQVNRIPPPPSYEQVLKDKCIEFKKSVAKPECHIDSID